MIAFKKNIFFLLIINLFFNFTEIESKFEKKNLFNTVCTKVKNTILYSLLSGGIVLFYFYNKYPHVFNNAFYKKNTTLEEIINEWFNLKLAENKVNYLIKLIKNNESYSKTDLQALEKIKLSIKNGGTFKLSNSFTYKIKEYFIDKKLSEDKIIYFSNMQPEDCFILNEYLDYINNKYNKITV